MDVLEVPTSKDGEIMTIIIVHYLTWCMIVLDGYFYVFVVIGVNFCMVLMCSRFVIILLYLV